MNTSIRVISATSIGPTKVNDEELSGKIDLSPCDLRLLLIDHIQKGILFHKPPTPQFSQLLHHLKAAFSQALHIFYPLAGRLISVDHHDGTQSFFIDCNGAGATFVHATADGSIAAADILRPAVVPDALVYSFFPMNRVLNYEAAVSDLPLISVQVTELADAIFVGVSLNHCAADGTFFWRFFNTWAQIARTGEVTSSRVFGRGFLDGIIDLPIRVPTHCLSSIAERSELGRLQQRIFRFSKAKIAELKAKSNGEIGAVNKISSLQALLAHLWISITRSRWLNARDEVTYIVAVGLRQRVGQTAASNLPEEYLGNAVLTVAVKSTAGELLEGGLGSAALQINKAIALQTPSEVRSYLKSWAESPKMGQIELLPVNALLTGSSPRFDVYGCDFGWGSPAAVLSGPGNKFDGKITVFAGAEEGSVDFEVCLCVETLEAMAGDAEFTKTLA